MASRPSNRARIQRMAEEAAATAKEKEAAKAARAPAAPKTPAAPPASRPRPARSARRMKLVWAVTTAEGKVLKVFPYASKAEAEAEAERLTAQKASRHFVRDKREPMDD